MKNKKSCYLNILKEGLKIYGKELAITKVERKSDFGNKAYSMKPETHQSLANVQFILYNNRSVEGTIKNFLDPNINPIKLISLEKKFDWSKSLYANLEKMVEVDLSLLNPNADDEIVTPNQLSELTDFFKANVGKFSDDEKSFLINRKIPLDVCQKWGFLGLSNFTEREHLRRIGATCHPILQTFLKDGIDEGGIVEPLFKDDILVNCSIRRITDVGKLKYTLAVPDIPVWGLDDVEGEEIIMTSKEDVISVGEWINKQINDIKFYLKYEPIRLFESQIREMEGSYEEFLEDRDRTNNIYKLLKKGEKANPIFVEMSDKSKFILEGRHRIVAFKWVDLKIVPVIYVK